MLLKKSKIILDILMLESSSSTTISYLGINDFLIPKLPNKDRYNWSYNGVSALLQQLIDEGYIFADSFYNGEYPIPDYRNIILTYKGLNYKEYNRKIKLNYFLKSILVPIIVSLTTSAIATFAGYIWGGRIFQSQHQNHVNNNEEIIETTIDTSNG